MNRVLGFTRALGMTCVQGKVYIHFSRNRVLKGQCVVVAYRMRIRGKVRQTDPTYWSLS